LKLPTLSEKKSPNETLSDVSSTSNPAAPCGTTTVWPPTIVVMSVASATVRTVSWAWVPASISELLRSNVPPNVPKKPPLPRTAVPKPSVRLTETPAKSDSNVVWTFVAETTIRSPSPAIVFFSSWNVPPSVNVELPTVIVASAVTVIRKNWPPGSVRLASAPGRSKCSFTGFVDVLNATWSEPVMWKPPTSIVLFGSVIWPATPCGVITNRPSGGSVRGSVSV
jgi:hypothetical protein